MINKTRFFLFVLLFLISGSVIGQNVRGFYVIGIGAWLGNTNKETDILEYAQGNGYNYINYYDLPDLDWNNPAQMNDLASFMSRARTQYGVTQMGAIVETYDFFTTYILPYNNSRSNPNEKFDIIDLEFEFWVNSSINALYCNQFLAPNGCSCDTAGAFKFAIKQFKLIDSACAVLGLTSEMYLGWPNQGQMQKFAAIADRILLHAYRPTDGDVYSYSKNRLKDIGTLHINKKILPLFSGESAFMGPWLNTHPCTRPFKTYSDDLAAETQSFKQYIDMEGYHWFTYDEMPKTILGTATISASGPLTFCPGDSVTLTANTGTDYLWSPGGETTQSITVSADGSYSVDVTATNGTTITSAAVLVSTNVSGNTPTISLSGPTSFCTGDSVTLTSSQANTYLWSTGATTQAINVSTTGNYSVITGSGTCTGTSSTVSVSVSTPPSSPSISASGPLDFCPGKNLILTSTIGNGYLWSNGATTRSIIVAAAGTYTVNVFSGTNCSAVSSPITINVLNSPAVPVITPGGSTTLTTSNPTVVLSASPAYSYLWTTGATTSSITVSTQGSYIVTAIDSNGCETFSIPVTVTASGCVPPALPVISFSTGSNIIPPGGSVILTANLASGYLWSTGETTRSILVSDSGVFTVSVFNGPSCFTTSFPVNIIVQLVTTGIGNLLQQSNGDYFTLFPNPAKEEFHVSFSAMRHNDFNFKLIDITGREILNKDIDGLPGENNFRFDVSDVSRGVYFAWLTGNENKQVIKVIVE